MIGNNQVISAAVKGRHKKVEYDYDEDVIDLMRGGENEGKLQNNTKPNDHRY